VVDTNLALLAPLGVDPPRSAQPDGRWLLETARRPEWPWDEPYAVVLPGTGGAHKVLPIATLGEVCRGLAALELAPVVLWGPGERQRAEEVVEAGGDAVRLAPPTDILEMAAVLGRAAVVIGADTGPVHLAASLAVPTVGVFLASDWRRNGPLGRRTAVISGALDRPQLPSGSARVPAERAVGADEIVAATRDLLEGSPR
jgi:heptosyltransferase-1